MTTTTAPQCMSCSRHVMESVEEPTGSCVAFPEGVPEAIWENEADHRQPFEGDRGIRFKARAGENLDVEDALGLFGRSEEWVEQAAALPEPTELMGGPASFRSLDPKWTLPTDLEGFLRWLDGTHLGMSDVARVEAFMKTRTASVMPRGLRQDLERMELLTR